MDGRQECRGNIVVARSMVPKGIRLSRAPSKQTIRSERSKLEKETVRRLFVFFRSVVLTVSARQKGSERETGGLGWLRRFKPGSPGQFYAGNLCIVSFVPLLSGSDPGPGAVLSSFQEGYSSREICITLVLIRRHSAVSTSRSFPPFFFFYICPRAIVYKSKTNFMLDPVMRSRFFSDPDLT